MKKKGIAFMVAGILAVGTLTGFAYANSINIDKEVLSEQETEQKVWDTNSGAVEIKKDKKDKDEKETYKDMIKIMKENGYKDAAKAMEKNDYDAMDEFMNNMTDEDYDNMIKIMRDSGYGYMADMMESMDREDMIEMHNSMGGAEGCHGTDSSGSSMMGGFERYK